MLRVKHLIACNHRIVSVKGFKMNKILINPYGLWGNGSCDIPYSLYKPKRKNAISGKARGRGGHPAPSIGHMHVCKFICLCNLVSSSIVFY